MKNIKVMFLKIVALVAILLPLVLTAQKPDYVLVIHGGAGNMQESKMTPEKLADAHSGLQKALDAGENILKAGGTALDAVEATIRVLEDCPVFNAGRGAVFNADGQIELDASIMDGSNLQAGAVAGVHTIKNPITAAREVMENSPHVLLIGLGAEKFASQQGLEIVDPEYFRTEHSWNEYLRIKQRDDDSGRKGTVGAVALDKHGNLAAGTSTGGMVMKKFGRVGDVPIIGAGTYASNETCAVSATGHGEYFIRNVVSYDISALMLYKGMRLYDAAYSVVMDKLVRQKGNGGVIAVDKNGNIAMPYNTSGMYRGFVNSVGETAVMIFAK
ncbi:MAG: isoaspartyl peptidase/L-asparaginase [Bacteroidales bacterium]|nr:isoaspartyl peptidase/L-asparaginase [Bacteroidales bacterium]MDZ4205051.1 isoaspartyl peptidase/L-asparaginase [Bacteroidales bacterium]